MEHVFQKVSTSSHCLPLKSLLDTERWLIAGMGQRGVQIKEESSRQSGRRNPGDRLHGQADGLGNAALGGKGQGLCPRAASSVPQPLHVSHARVVMNSLHAVAGVARARAHSPLKQPGSLLGSLQRFSVPLYLLSSVLGKPLPTVPPHQFQS